jgi:hypothetical protein
MHGSWTPFGVIALLAALQGCSEPPAEPGGVAATERPALTLGVNEKAKLQAWDAWHGDRFGNSVALSDNLALIGSSSDDDNRLVDEGSAFVFTRHSDVWYAAAKLAASDGAAYDGFGSAVAISEDVAVVGASECDIGANTDVGAVYVFRAVGSAWVQSQKLVPADGGSSDERFGTALALDGDTLAVGARGVVRVFVRSGELWSEQEKLTPPPEAQQTGFGSVALSGDTLLVGSSRDAVGSEFEQGAVHVYTRAVTNWHLQDSLFAADGRAQDRFGTTVALSDDTAVIGTASTLEAGRRADSAYVFFRSDGVFTQQAKLNPSDQLVTDGFGLSAAVQGDFAVVGAPFHEHSGTNANHGSAYLFGRSGSTWTQLWEILARDRQNNDHFGSALALTGTSVLIGAPNDDVPFSANGSGYIFDIVSLQGRTCATGAECLTGFCSDGVCCDEACAGACNACSIAAGAEYDGACALLQPGSPGMPACAPLSCNGQTADCPVPSHLRCNDDATCFVGEFCHSSGVCLPKKATGRACEASAGADCLQGGCDVCATGQCVDGYCCNTTCDGSCNACAQALTGAPNGSCAPVRAGMDPKDDCTKDADYPMSCGADGACDGTGLCRFAPVGTPCAELSCSGQNVTTSACDGSGHCVESTLDCNVSGGVGGTGSGGSTSSGGTSGTGTTAGTGGTGTGGGHGGTSGSNATGGAGGVGTGGSAGTGGVGGTGGATLACARVAPSGNDASALASQGQLAFRSVQAAVDFAASHSALTRKVCVAGGPSCGDQSSYASPFMRNGITVSGSYEATGWTECEDISTELAADGEGGVWFGAEVQSPTLLEGFRIRGPASGDGPAVAIVEASGAELSGVAIEALGGVGLHAVDATFALSDSSVDARASEESIAVLLESAPGSRIAGNLIDVETTWGEAIAVRATGDQTQLELSDNRIQAFSGEGAVSAVVFTDCTAGSAQLVNNSRISASGSGSSLPIEGIVATGACSPWIAGNQLINGGSERAPLTGIRCSEGSRCSIVDNDITNASSVNLSGSEVHGTGIGCGPGSCDEISGNLVTGLNATGGCHRVCTFYGTGISLTQTDTLVDDNVVYAGCADVAVGVFSLEASARIQNNRISGGTCNLDNRESTGMFASGPLDVHSNLIDARGETSDGGLMTLPCVGTGVSIGSGTPSFRNNIVLSGRCAEKRALAGAGTSAVGPITLENNLFESFVTQFGVLTPEQVNAHPSFDASDNFNADPRFVDGVHLASDSPCIDAGTPVGAPAIDFDGEVRDASPDVGPDEWSAVNDICLGETCSGFGRCVDNGSGKQCQCNPGYFNPPGDPLSCDENACFFDNGGCDDLTTCQDTADGRICGACPPTHNGTGETGCIPGGPCQPNRCFNATCIEVDDTAVCDCAPGYAGPRCEEAAVVDLVAGDAHTCGIRGARAECWGANERGQSTPKPGFFFRLATGAAHTCGLRGIRNVNYQGPVECWGENSHGQASPPPGDFLSLTAGARHTCGLRSDRVPVCWGDNSDGQTAIPAGAGGIMSAGPNHTCGEGPDGQTVCWGGDERGEATPPIGSFGSGATGDTHTCTRSSNGRALCWGNNDSGQATAPSLHGAQTIYAAGDHSCQKTSDDYLVCWGASFRGNAAIPSEKVDFVAIGRDHGCSGNRFNPALRCWGDNRRGQASVSGGAFRAVSVQHDHACALHWNGSLECWGEDAEGQSLPPSGVFESVSVGHQFGCALREDGTVACWGSDFGATTPATGSFEAIAAGAHHVCGLRPDFTVACWGRDDVGQSTAPAGEFQSLAAGFQHTCGIRRDGTLQCWGSNAAGEASPPAGTFAALSAAASHACAVRSDGAVLCWGLDAYGPAGATPSGSFVDVATGPEHGCGIRDDGSLSCWGRNDFGESTPRSGSYRAIAVGATGQTCGIASDLTLHCWGAIVR